MKKWLRPLLRPSSRPLLRSLLVLLLIPTVFSCGITDHDDFYQSSMDKGEIDSHNLPKHALNDIVKGLAYQMLANSSFVNAKTPVAVTSFVKLDDLETTNWLGNQLAESFVHEFQRHGLVVIDFKTTGHIRVTKEGDYVFSRDWKELPERQVIDYIVAGTMVEQQDGILVNARMIGIKSKVVVATAQSFIPNWVLGDALNPNEQSKMIDGMIIRRDNSLLEEQSTIKIHH